MFIILKLHSYINDGLFGLCHVGNDAVCDDEEHKVLGAVLHRGGISAYRQTLEAAL